MVRDEGKPDDPRTGGKSATATSTGDLSRQERLEASTGGRWLLRAFLALTVTALVVFNFPSSGIRSAALPLVERYINATGLTQGWNVFAPDPPGFTSEVVARIDYLDGTSFRWQAPRGGDVVGEYRTYHWAVVTGRLSGEGWRSLREPFARWLARTHSEGGRRPVRVELISRVRPNLPPGTDAPPPPWTESTVFSLDLRPSGAR